MRKLTVITVLAICFAFGAKAQWFLATVEHNDSTTGVYTNIDTAIAYAQTGDFIYVNAGLLGDVTLDKELHLVGTGYHPDSTYVNGISYITNLYLNTGADSSSITGFDIDDLDNTSNPINSFFASRCKIDNIFLNNLSTSFTSEVQRQLLSFVKNRIRV